MYYTRFIAIIIFFAFSLAVAQEPPIDMVDKVITDLFRNQGGQALCMPQGASRESVREALKDRLKDIDTNDEASANAIAIAIYTVFPCPFSPYRPELRPAKAADLTGNWLFPEGSQRFRYGPKSQAWQSNPGMPPFKCEGVSYLENGVLLVAQVL